MSIIRRLNKKCPDCHGTLIEVEEDGDKYIQCKNIDCGYIEEVKYHGKKKRVNKWKNDELWE